MDELLAAAKLLRRRAGEATPGPWWRPLTTRFKASVRAPFPQWERAALDTGEREACTVVSVPVWSGTGRHVRRRSGRDLEYVALMDPRVGSALADLLEEQVTAAKGEWDGDALLNEAELSARYAAPLAIARLLLGEKGSVDD